MDNTKDERPRGRRHELVTGRRVGRYQLSCQLGVGGMGVVWLATDPVLARRVALKFLRVERAGAPSEERFVREARAMARLSHPNVVGVFDIGNVDAGAFFAMEYVEGTTLDRWLQADPRSWQQIAEMFAAAGEGLAAAHAAGLVHRDFKPSNVLVGHDGRVKVADFGIAYAIAEPRALDGGWSPVPSPRLTSPGAAPGTPGYMAPEVLAGEIAGPAADQFAFAVSLHEALAHAAAVPRELVGIVSRGLAARPTDRYPTMSALLDELRGVLVHDAAPELTFGFTPTDPLSEKRRHAAELASYLERAGVRVRASYGADYRGLVEDLVAGRNDVAWLAPLSLVRAGRGVRAVLVLSRAGRSTYHGAFVVRRDANISTIEDLAGRRIGWVDDDSASGYVLPRALIAARHPQVDRFFSVERMLGSHRAVVQAVLDGWVDVGATFMNRAVDGAITASGWMEFLGDRGHELTPIAATGPIAGDVIAVRASLPDRDVARLVGAMRALAADPEGIPLLSKVFNGADGVEAPVPDAYEELAALAQSSGWRP